MLKNDLWLSKCHIIRLFHITDPTWCQLRKCLCHRDLTRVTKLMALNLWLVTKLWSNDYLASCNNLCFFLYCRYSFFISHFLTKLPLLLVQNVIVSLSFSRLFQLHTKVGFSRVSGLCWNVLIQVRSWWILSLSLKFEVFANLGFISFDLFWFIS
jgi:hypothetical protein